MEAPVQIEFHGLQPTGWVRDRVGALVQRLERRYGRMTAGRVAVGLDRREPTGGVYHVTLRLTLPQGREVNVARVPSADARFTELAFAVNDAFRRAERQLRAHAQRLRGDAPRPSLRQAIR